MKKLILIIILLCLTSCYDYKEVNDLAIISTIAIDYDKKFNVYFEILKDQKNNNNTSYIISDNGDSLTDAFDNISLKIDNIPYYNHLKVVIISKEIASNHFKEICEYITRNPSIRNEFYLVITDNIDKILLSKNDNNPIISENISKLIKTNKRNYNISYDKPFEDILEKILNPNTDAITTYIGVNDKEISLKGISIFKDYKYMETLNKDYSALLNLLLKNNNSISLENNDTFVKVNTSSLDYKINKNNIKININTYGTIIQCNDNLNIKDSDTLTTLNKDFNVILNNKLSEFINYIKKNNYQIININNLYYKKYKQEIDLNDIDIIIKTDLKITKKGLIYNE